VDKFYSAVEKIHEMDNITSGFKIFVVFATLKLFSSTKNDKQIFICPTWHTSLQRKKERGKKAVG